MRVQDYPHSYQFSKPYEAKGGKGGGIISQSKQLAK